MLGAQDLSSPRNIAIDGSVLPYFYQPAQLCVYAEIKKKKKKGFLLEVYIVFFYLSIFFFKLLKVNFLN